VKKLVLLFGMFIAASFPQHLSAAVNGGESKLASLPLTYCNPLPLENYQPGGYVNRKDASRRWMHSDIKRDYREMADPTVIRYKGRYFLFPSCGMLWYSDDLVNWTYHPIEPHDIGYAPTVAEYHGYLYMTANGKEMWRAKDPLGPWEMLGKIKDENGKPTSWKDPCLFVDDDGSVYCYNGLGADGIYVVKLKKDDLTSFDGPNKHCFAFNPEHIWERFGELNQNPDKSCVEGSWMTKHNGKYYLQYSAPGTMLKNYALGCYIGDTPTGPWRYQKRNPILIHKGGLVNGCGHHSMVEGPDGNLWCIYTTLVRIEHGFERRVGMDPVGFDENGEMFVSGPSETPQLAPGIKPKPYLDNSAGLMNVSEGWMASASSYAVGHEPFFAIDGNIRTWWEAADSTTEQWVMVDMERVYDTYAARTMFADRGLDYANGVVPGPYSYVIEGSLDGKKWSVLLDQSQNKVDRHIAYDTFAPRPARYVRLVVKSAPKGMKIAVWEFSVFGKAPVRE
jgi:hypothetical protein